MKVQEKNQRKKNREFKIVDKYLILFSFFGIAILLFLLNEDSLYEGEKQHQNTKIGYIENPIQDVRRRIKNEFSWMPINNKDLVYLGDSIYTGEKSTVIVNLENGVNLTVDPNSLIVLDPNNDAVKLNLKFGNIKGKLGNKLNSSINLDLNSQELQLDGKSVEFSLAKRGIGNVQLKVVEGNAKLTDSKSKKQLSINKRNTINFNRDLASIPKVKSFEEEIEFVRKEQWGLDKSFWFNSKQPLKFLWQAEGSVDHFEISISQNSKMKNPIVSESVKVNGYSWVPPFENGSLYWQVKAFKEPNKKEFIVSDIIHWDIGILSAPEWQNPESPQYVTVSELRVPINSENEARKILKWQTALKSQRYKLEWSNRSDFAEKLALDLKDNQWPIPEWNAGRYFVRVRSERVGRPSSIWSNLKIIEVLEKDPDGLVSPQLATHELESIENKESVQIKWEPQVKTENYIIERSLLGNFSKIIQSDKLKGTQWKYSAQNKGTYFIRLFPISTKGRRGPVSKTIIWNVRVPGPKWKYAKNEVNIIIPRDKNNQIMNFPETSLLWTMENSKLVKEYRLVSSVDNEFKNKNETLVLGQQYKISNLKPGEYFYKIQALLNDQSESVYSEPLKIMVSEEGTINIKAPQLISDKIETQLDEHNRAKGQFKWSNLDKIKKYKIQLSQDFDFKKILLEKMVPKNEFQHIMNTPGEIYGRVSGVDDKERTGAWSKVFQWSIQYEKPQIQEIKDISVLESKSKLNINTPIRWVSHKEIKKFKLEVVKIEGNNIPNTIANDKKTSSRKQASDENSTLTEIYDGEVIGRSYHLKLNTSGKYRAKVKGIDNSGRDITDFSEPSYFNVVVKKLLLAPLLEIPKNKVSYILSKLKNPEVWLQWNSTKDVSEFSIEIAKDSSFKKIIISKKLTDNKLLIDHNTVRGKLYWRVKSHLLSEHENGESPWSDTWSFSIVQIENED